MNNVEQKDNENNLDSNGKITDNRVLTDSTTFLNDFDPMLRGDKTHEYSFFIKAVQEDGLIAEIKNVTARERYEGVVYIKRQDENIVSFTSDLRKTRQAAIEDVLSSVMYEYSKLLWISVRYVPTISVYYSLPSVENTYCFELKVTGRDGSNDFFTFFDEVKESELASFKQISDHSPLKSKFHPEDGLNSGKLELKNSSSSLNISSEKVDSSGSSSNSVNRVYRYTDWIRTDGLEFANKTYIDNVYKDPSNKSIVYITVRTPLELATFKFPIVYEEDTPVWHLIENVGQGDLYEIRSETVYIRPRVFSKSMFSIDINASKTVPGRVLEDEINGTNIKYCFGEDEYDDELIATKIRSHSEYIPIGVDFDYQWNLYIKKESDTNEEENSKKPSENKVNTLKESVKSLFNE